MSAQFVYDKLPVPLQDVACSAEGWRIRWDRYNHDFFRRLVDAERRDGFSADELMLYQAVRVQEFIRHAATTVPYYQNLFRKIGADSRDFKNVTDLEQLPILTKLEVQKSPELFLSRAVSRRDRVRLHTSGTTGAGLKFWTTKAALREQYAIWWRHLRRHGIRQGTWCAYLGGRSIVPVEQKKPPFWRINYPGRQVLFSAYPTSPAHLSLYLEEIRTRQFPWIHGYPSHIALLANHLIDTRFDLGYRPRWITTSSENLHSHQAQTIQAAFGVTPIQNYGMTEAVANMSQTQDGLFQVDEDFSAVEFLPVGKDGVYKVVGTNFSNPATPLLRYETGDLVRLSPKVDQAGHRGRLVESIDGRSEDYVVLSNGVRIGRLDHVFKDLMNVREAQIRQATPGSIAVRIVRASSYGDSDEAALLHGLRTRLGADIEIDLRYEDAIEKTKSGKLRFVVSELNGAGNVNQ